MDDEVLMRVVHRARRHRGRDAAAPRSSRRCRSQYVVIGTPSTYSITRYGQLPVGDAAVEQLRDVRVLQRREDLPLGDEAPVEIFGIGRCCAAALTATRCRYCPSSRSAR